MKKNIFYFLTFLTLGLCPLASAHASSIGLVNFSTCITESKYGKDEQASFEQVKTQMTTLISDLEKKLQEIAGKFNDPEFTDQTTVPGPYRVGVHYYSDSLLGPSDATIKVYLQGRLAGEWVRTLNSTNNFWEVSGIIWTNSDKRVQEINRFYTSMP